MSGERVGTVWIFDRHARTPIYHRWGHWSDAARASFTACGLMVGQYDHEWVLTTIGIWLRRVHADAFARPCRRCYAEARP